MADIAKEHGLFLISDEVYREFVYGGEPLASMAQFDDAAENVVVVDSISKRFSACGARVGILVSRNRELMAQALKICQGRLCAATLDQLGAAALYGVGSDYFSAVREEYHRRRDTCMEGLSQIPGVVCECPKGAFYLMAKLPVDDTDKFQTACGKIREAAKNGADFAVLPEMFCCPYDNSCFGAYGEPEGGEAQTALSHLAAELGLYLVGGTVPELSEGRIYNTSYVYGPDGRQLAKHRKAHLFDIDVQGGQRFRESDTLSPGNAITTFETAFGTMGLCVCFDLRFEELARCMCLRGAKVIFVPAAFNMTTGPAHWELLFRQRAVDNQCFTVGVSPARDEQGSYVAYGNSIAVDPWGAVLCRAGAEETTLYADLDMDRLEAVRAQLPILSARRTDLYEVREK